MIRYQLQSGKTLRELMETTQLPVLPPNTPYLLKAMSSEEIGFGELAAVVEKFPTIAARLISLANSTWSSPVVKVTSLEMACARLGFFVVRSVSVALSISNIFNPRACPAFDPIRYWTNAFLSADVSTTLTRQREEADEPDPHAVRTGGLLHNLGLLWLATWMPEETQRALLTLGEETEAPLDQLLAHECGTGFAEAGALLAEAWKFPDLLIHALRHQLDEQYDGEDWETAALIGLSGRLLQAPEGETGLSDSDPRWRRLGLAPETESLMHHHISQRRPEIHGLAEALFAG